jgi:hypothetical protein
MIRTRRRLASWALAVVLLQLTLLLAAPLAACCVPGDPSGAPAAGRARSEAEECCPPGSHPPGQCPLHRDARKAPRSSSTAASDCRIRCNASLESGLVVSPAGVLPRRTIAVETPAVADLTIARVPSPSARTARPDSPPPRLL